MRGFKKISKVAYLKDGDLNYENVRLPERATAASAGYDFVLPTDVELVSGASVIVKTGIKAFMEKDEFLMIIIRSSLGFKHNLRLRNQVGVIDSDYYDNKDNEGHIMIAIKNEGNSNVLLQAGSKVAQGIFMKYLTVSDEKESDLQRIGGIGSTDATEATPVAAPEKV